MKRQQPFQDDNLKRSKEEVMEISSTGYGYEFHPINEKQKMIKRKNK